MLFPILHFSYWSSALSNDFSIVLKFYIHTKVFYIIIIIFAVVITANVLSIDCSCDAVLFAAFSSICTNHHWVYKSYKSKDIIYVFWVRALSGISDYLSKLLYILLHQITNPSFCYMTRISLSSGSHFANSHTHTFGTTPIARPNQVVLTTPRYLD